MRRCRLALCGPRLDYAFAQLPVALLLIRARPCLAVSVLTWWSAAIRGTIGWAHREGGNTGRPRPRRRSGDGANDTRTMRFDVPQAATAQHLCGQPLTGITWLDR